MITWWILRNRTRKPGCRRLAAGAPGTRGALALLGGALWLGVLTGSAGCGYSGGQALYAFGLFQNKKVDAQFTLSAGPILILIDDPNEIVDWPVFTRLLNDDLAQELLKNKAAQKIIPIQTLQSIQQTEPNFSKRGAREIGELAGAEQVIWIEIEDFLASDQIEQVSEAAFVVVSIRVIDAKATNKWKARLWPDNPQGKIVQVQLNASAVHRAKSRDGVAKALSAELARKLAHPFYSRRLEDNEVEE